MRTYARTISLAITWILLSASLVFLNKFIMTKSAFRFPLTLALLHMLSCSAFCGLIFRIRPRLYTAQTCDSKGGLTLGLCGVSGLFALSLTCSNAALTSLDVATIQTLKALNPLLIYLASVISGVSKPSPRTASIVAVICMGIILSVRGSPEFRPVGLALQIASISADSVRYLALQAYMQSQHLSLDALNVLYIVAPAAAVFLWVPASLLEFSTLFDSRETLIESSSLVIASCSIACALNLTSNAFIRATSALTMSVSGVLKDALMIGLSLAYFGSPTTPMECAGFALTLLASCAYSLHSVRGK